MQSYVLLGDLIDNFPALFPGSPVRVQDRFKGIRRHRTQRCQCLFHYPGNLSKANGMMKLPVYGNLIGCVQYTASGSASAECFISKPKGRKSFKIRLFKP